MSEINTEFVGKKYSREEQRWIKSLGTLLCEDDPGNLLHWLNQNVGQLDKSFINALSTISDHLLLHTSIASTQQIFRLVLIVNELFLRKVHYSFEEPWKIRLIKIQKILEEDGIGPRSSLDRNPAEVYKRVLNYRGCCLAEKGEYIAAIEHFNATISIDAQFVPAYCNRARALMELNRLEAAWADCNTLCNFDPNYPMGRATCQLVDTLCQLKASQEGTVAELAEEQELLEYLRLYDRPLKRGEYAPNLKELLNPPQAKVLSEENVTPEQLNHLGVVRGRSGDYKEAIAAFNQALQMNPEYEEARYNRGKAYQLAGEYEKAIADFSFIIERNPQDTDAYYLRAQAYRAADKVVEAKADEKRVSC